MGVAGDGVMDLSEEDAQAFRIQRILQQQAKNLTGQKPRQKIPRSELIKALEDRTILDEGCTFSGAKYDSIDFYIEPYPPSCTRPELLTKIYIDDLKLETIHRGNVIFLRTITEAKRLTSASIIVEDERGDATQLQVYHIGRNIDLKEMFPKGQVIVIKEPFFKFSSTAMPSIRVDHFTDMLLLDDDEVMVPESWAIEEIDRSAEDYKGFGNDAMRMGKTREAIKWYTAGIKIAEASDMRLALLLNRCLAHLYYESYQLCVEDADAALLISPNSEKALFRKAKALYELRRFAKCGNTLKQLTKTYPSNAEAIKDLERVRQRVSEETFGQFDSKKLVKMARSDKPGMEYDFADYTAPVYTKTSDINGNGLFTKRAVKAGELLCCCKAFANCKGKENGISLTMDPVSMTVSQAPGAFVADVVLEKLRREPFLLAEIAKLYNDLEYKQGVGNPEQSDTPVIDSFLIKQIVRLNAFSSSSYYDEFPEMRSTPTSFRNPSKSKENPFDPNCGFWILPSYMNHSCVPNARRVILGDMMVIHAAVDIPKDTEILISYTDSKQPYQDRQGMFELSWGFTCHCQQCKFESTVNKSMEDIMFEMQSIVLEVGYGMGTVQVAEKMMELCGKLERFYTHPAVQVPRWFLGEHLIRLYGYYSDVGMAQEAFTALHMAPRAFGAIYDVTENDGVVFWHKGWADADLVRAYVRLAAITGVVGGRVADGWLQVAKDMYRVVAGEVDTFEETFGGVIGSWKE
ncbi:hypothetical protein TWF694_003048 [Orbilia ellipsospora]|uniref:SET domain-containing protein n=1 Tax=Orbilia ellipsospora TaxID=2528407 RepID=A0AAV9X0H0_9PEZI